jgi:hypoxanthine phosphoribosyltransferase
MKQKILTWERFDQEVNYLCFQIKNNEFRPNWIIGLARGGSCLATTLSYKLEIPVIIYDPKRQELSDIKVNWNKDKILIVDDINDTGVTLTSIKQSIVKFIHPELNKINESIFELNNIRSAVIYNNEVSNFKVNYSTIDINKANDDSWIVFPWEK